MPLTRRDFVARSAFYGSTFWLLWNVPRPLAFRAAQESGERLVLTEDEWNLVEAITGRIIPTDHEPGAVEANCVNFIDKVLAHEDAYLKPTYYRGLPGVDAVTEERFGRRFVELRTEEQDAVLEALESGDVQSWPSDEVAPEEFFEAVRVHTIIGEQLEVNTDELVPEANLLDDLGADSLDVVELAMALEDEFGLQVPDEDLENIRTVQDIVDYISKHAGVTN